jgi:diguanylate cyclase (GGDEF)-like protein
MKPELLSRLPEILFQIGKVIGSNDSLSHTLDTISELVTELTGAGACSIMLADKRNQRLLGRAAYGLARDDISEVSFRYGEGVAGWVAQHAVPALIDDVTQDVRFKTLEDSSSHIRSMACVPLVNRDHVVGVMTITTELPASFSSESLDLLKLVATTIALDIENIRLRRLSVTDKLTGAYNREFLDRQLPQSLAEALRSGEALSIAMFDVDHFKDVNDSYGHDVGDEVLKIIAARLRDGSRGRDMLVRYGGEEFLLLLPGANLATAAEIADRIRVRIQDSKIHVGEHQLQIRISAGVAQQHPGETGEDLFKRADRALYNAKDHGRNRIELAD